MHSNDHTGYHRYLLSVPLLALFPFLLHIYPVLALHLSSDFGRGVSDSTNGAPTSQLYCQQPHLPIAHQISQAFVSKKKKDFLPTVQPKFELCQSHPWPRVDLPSVAKVVLVHARHLLGWNCHLQSLKTSQHHITATFRNSPGHGQIFPTMMTTCM